MNIADLLSARAALDGGRTAIIDESGGRCRTLTFAELELRVDRTAQTLRARGLQPGDPVLVLQPLSLELCVALVALLRAGLVAVFVDPSAGLAHLESCCRLTTPRAFLGCGKAHLLRLFSPGLRRIPMKCRTTSLVRQAAAAIPAAHPAPGAVDLPAHAPAVVRFTSGSTGEPNAAVRTHGFLLEQLHAIESHLKLQAGQVDLVTMPMFMLPNLAAGVTSVIPGIDVRSPGRIRPAALVRQIQARRPDRLTASPALFQRLARHCAQHAVSLDSLRRLDTGGAPVFPDLLDAMHRMAPLADVAAVYGSTEAEPIAILPRERINQSDRDAMAGGNGLLAGRPVPGIELRVLREDAAPLPAGESLPAPDFDALCLPVGQPGEIVVSGPHVHPGQPGEAHSDAAKIRVGNTVWHRTGDAGRLDSDGRLWLLGRSAARITDARGTLYPFQIEAAAMADPSVHRAALVAEDGRRVLVVQPADWNRPPLVSDWVRAQVDDVRPMRTIPVDRRHNAKVDYRALWKRLPARRLEERP